MTNGQIRPNDIAGELFEDEELVLRPLTKSNRYVTKSQPIGIIGVLCGVVFLVSANVLGTEFGRSGIWITMWRSLFAVIILGIYVKYRKQTINFESFKICLIPSIAFTIHIICFYQAIQFTPLTNVVIIRALQPALTLFFVGTQFNEKVKPSNVIAAITAFIGVSLTVWGTALTGTNNLRGDLLAVCALGAWVALFIFTKKARVHVGTASFMFYTTSMSGVVALILVPFTHEALMPTSIEATKLLAMAVCASLGHGFISWSHKYTKLSTASLLTLITPVGSTICAAIFFGQSITTMIAVGISIVMVSIAFVIKNDTSTKEKELDPRLDIDQAA